VIGATKFLLGRD